MLERYRRRYRQAKNLRKLWKTMKKVWKRREVFAGLKDLRG